MNLPFLRAFLFSFICICCIQFANAQTRQFRLWGVTASGANGHGSIFDMEANGTGFDKAKTFQSNQDGERPRGTLIQAADGNLYGVTESGGAYGFGAIFRLKMDGTAYTVLHHFSKTDGRNPYNKLIQASDGLLYGMTLSGGISDRGVIYKLKTDGSGFTILHQFDGQGSQPQCGLLQASDGALYGLTTQGGTSDSGVLFKITPNGTGFAVLLNFGDYSVRSPRGSLVQGNDGRLYGLTSQGGSSGNGVAFKVDKSGLNFSTLVEFSSSTGINPNGSLARNSAGELFGTTASGGTYSGGVIFKMNSDGSNYTKLYEFDFSTGSYPENVYATNDGKLIGSTWMGGLYKQGVIFSIGSDGSDFLKLVDFNGDNGSTPYTNGIMQATNGDFYGLSSYGGTSNNGVIFKLDGSGTYAKLKEFYTEGSIARGNMIKASNGNLYGMTAAGGTYGFGVIYRIKKDGSDYSKLFDFDKITTGGAPEGSLFEASDGNLYGLTATGGLNDAGTLFQIKLDGSNFNKLHDFDFNDGGQPWGSLIEINGGELIGTTSIGGINNGGSLFKINFSGSNFVTLFKFNSPSTGGSPNDVTITEDGYLIGTCIGGGANDYGTIFRIKPDGTSFSKLIDFDGITKGATPRSGLTKISATEFAGTTSSGGGNNQGSIFKISSDGSGFSRLFNFSLSTGLSPLTGRLTLLPDGFLYGMTWVGGAKSGGTVYKVKTDGTGFVKLYEFSEESGNYPLTSGLIAVERETQTISFDPFSPKTFGDTPFTLLATASSDLSVTFESSNQSVATINNNIVTIIGAGTTTITAKQSGNIAYFPSSQQQILTVNKKDQSITFASISPVVFRSSAITLPASSTSGLQISYSSSDETKAIVSGNVLTVVNAGDVTITAKQSGNANYFPANDVPQLVTINKAEQNIFFELSGPKKYKDQFVLSASSSSNLPVSFRSGDEGIAIVSGNEVNIVGIGTVSIIASQAGGNNYVAAPEISRTLLVTKSESTITFDPIPQKQIRDDAFLLLATSNSDQPILFSSSNTEVATIDGDNKVQIVGLGSTIITASQGGSEYYNPAEDVTRTLVVTKRVQTIIFSPIDSKVFGEEPFSLAAITGKQVSYFIDNESVARLEGNMVSIVGAGSAVITASLPGDDIFESASASQVLTVKKADQEIVFTLISNKNFGDTSFELVSSSSSGLPVKYSSSSDNITIVDSEVTLLEPGRTKIVASQTGDINYNAASEVGQSFCINPQRPSIIQTTEVTGHPSLHSSSSSGNQWYRNGVLIEGKKDNSFSPDVSGSYTLKVMVDDCPSESSESVDLVITGLEESTNQAISFYPNPVTDELKIDLSSIPGEVKVSVYDMIGRKKEFLVASGSRSLIINTSQYNPGSYVLQVIHDKGVLQKQFVKN